VALIIARILLLSSALLAHGAISSPLLTEAQFTILILMAFITTLITPISLRLTVPRVCSDSDQDFCHLWRNSPLN
jgi:hypothetical protein